MSPLLLLLLLLLSSLLLPAAVVETTSEGGTMSKVTMTHMSSASSVSRATTCTWYSPCGQYRQQQQQERGQGQGQHGQQAM
jgi:hypothetical protein